MLLENIRVKFNSINLFERFKAISEAFQTEMPLEDYSTTKVAEVLKRTGYDFQYNNKEGFFSLSSIEHGYNFRLNLILKYGIVEVVMWAENIETKEQYGGVLSRLMKLLQKSNSVQEIVRVRYPRFSDYEELEKIVKGLIPIYIDFKSVIVSP